MLTFFCSPGLLGAVAEAWLHHAVAAVQARIQSEKLLDIDSDYTGNGRACFGRWGPEVRLRWGDDCWSGRGWGVVVVVSARGRRAGCQRQGCYDAVVAHRLGQGCPEWMLLMVEKQWRW